MKLDKNRPANDPAHDPVTGPAGGPARRQPLIIDQPALQGRSSRRWSTAFTLLFWLLWFALWIPVINLGAWLLGHEPLLFSPPELFSGRHQFWMMVTWHVVVIAMIPGTLGVWAMYNLVKFKGKERRVLPHSLSLEDTAVWFEVDPQALVRWQRSRRLVIHFAGDRIHAVGVAPPPTPP
ncbi:MAG: poly-beta-1,6-N-acetyl-D-glucosamine biosynthesis protein PgaD [Nitrospirota bacterium]|nr:poly-beta-1,6-N-acetyl-D-glucosamine biosynthesis protein PgaD [Nitrospirota bacterium]